MKLLIVESPAKTKTINAFLGSEYKVMASMGHIRDLPKKDIGVDISNNFSPKYIMSSEKIKKANNKRLKEEAAKAEIVYLCTDLDREGEAIAWHLIEGLKIPANKIKRATFSEITKKAVLDALNNPRNLDMDLVNAQQARRILDRIVGYKLSPFLWKKLPYQGLSAGRVQSAALKLIVDREKEINDFIPEEYWKIIATLQKNENNAMEFKSIYFGDWKDSKKQKKTLTTREDAESVSNGIKDAEWVVNDIVRKESVRKAPVPFTTSTLQMEAARKLNMSAERTMKAAQQLYEGIDINGAHKALITYMRTDSLNLSEDALTVIRKVIESDYGADYLPDNAIKYKTKSKGAQEAHEAIRPTDQNIKPDDLKGKISDELFKLYDLIWKRTVSCQMKPAIFDTSTVTIIADNKHCFISKGSIMKFKGFLLVYEEGVDDKEEDDSTQLPDLSKDEKVICNEITPEQKFTQPPARYSEATLVKEMEKNGVGRPSTYAAILNNIKKRKYVITEKKRFVPTDVGTAVINLLDETFPKVTNIGFTAEVENTLDDVAAGELDWVTMLSNWYFPFEKTLKEQVKTTHHVMPENEILCPSCNKPMAIKRSKTGQFLGCTGYPNCKQTLGIDGKPSVKPKSKKHPTKTCPNCSGSLLEKKGKFGVFYGCENFPECKYIDSDKKKAPVKNTGIKCAKCEGGEIVERKSKKGTIFWGCNNFPKCKNVIWDDPTKKNN